MRALLFVAALALVPPDRPDPTPKQEPRTLQDELLGHWRLDKVAIAGNLGAPQVNDKEVRTVQITKSEILVAVNGQARPDDSSTYTIDLSKKPVTIDLMSRNNGGMKFQGILKLEGDQLTLCFTVNGARPTEFNAGANELTFLMQLQRVKK